MARTIFHIDVNSAFLSWSAVKRLKEDPGCVDLRTVPSVVGGDIKTRHGIVTAKSIPAKKYGIETAEPITGALSKCPNLIVIPSDFETYREYSHAFIDILLTYSQIMQQVSIDEAFLDVTELESMDVREHLKSSFLADSTGNGIDNKSFSDICKEIDDDETFAEPFPINVAAAIRYEVSAS